MRRIVVFEWMTADGYFAGSDGNLDWVVPDEEQASAAAKGIPGFDTVLFGRRTYEMFAGSGRAPSTMTTAPRCPIPTTPGGAHGSIASSPSR
jgi:dihydrofolate reductase